MATYFYTKNDDGNMQIDDDYEAIVSIKSGDIYAKIAAGQIYGLVLTAAPATSAGFRIDSGEIFISPPVPYGGTFVVYVATNGNNQYIVNSCQMPDLPKSGHLAGITKSINSAGENVD